MSLSLSHQASHWPSFLIWWLLGTAALWRKHCYWRRFHNSNELSMLSWLTKCGHLKWHSHPRWVKSVMRLSMMSSRDLFSADGSGRCRAPNLALLSSFSDTEALIHLIKMNVGIGVMAMPSAFYNSGMLVGIVAMVFMAIITVHCMHLLVRAWFGTLIKNPN